MKTHTHTPTHTHLMGEDFGVLPQALLQLQLLRHFCELLGDKLGDWENTGKKKRKNREIQIHYGNAFPRGN